MPAPVICDFLSREASRRVFAPGTEFQIGRIDMVANTATYVDSPFHRYSEGKDLARWLKGAGAALVGIDSHIIDCTDTGERPVHSTLVGADIPIVEHLCGLDAVPEAGSKFFAVPVKVKGFGTFPVRTFAAIES